MNTISLLSRDAKNLSVLYADSSKSYNEKITQFLTKLFFKVYNVDSAEQALRIYKKHNPDIVITDITLKAMNGLEMAKRIKHFKPSAKIMLFSHEDDKEYLYAAINIGIEKFLKKPIKTEFFIEALYEVVHKIKHEERVDSINKYEGSGSLIAIYEDKHIKLANHVFLELFGCKDEKEFETKYDIDEIFIECDDFLYSGAISWYDKVIHNLDHSFQVCVKNHQGEYMHLTLKAEFLYENVTSGKDDILLIFNDITDLNLLPQSEKINSYEQNSQATQKLLKYLQKSNSTIQLYSFYKGLTITNKGQIIFVGDNQISFKTNYNQQKAIMKQKSVVINSQLLPQDVYCEDIMSVDQDKFITTMKHYRLLDSTPRKRKKVRVVPKESYKVELIFNEKSYNVEHIEDLSVDAVKISMNALAAGVEKNVTIKLVIDFFEEDESIESFEIDALVYKIFIQNMMYKIVCTFKLQQQDEHRLLKLISKRQIELIREFKSI